MKGVIRLETKQATSDKASDKGKRLIYADDLKKKAFPDPDSGEGMVYVQDVDEAPTVDAAEVVRGMWIPVTERLPENDVMVIGYTPCDGFMFVGYYHEEPKYDWKVWRIVTAMRSTKVMKKKVTHWLPLPEPPKEETNG